MIVYDTLRAQVSDTNKLRDIAIPMLTLYLVCFGMFEIGGIIEWEKQLPDHQALVEQIREANETATAEWQEAVEEAETQHAIDLIEAEAAEQLWTTIEGSHELGNSITTEESVGVAIRELIYDQADLTTSERIAHIELLRTHPDTYERFLEDHITYETQGVDAVVPVVALHPTLPAEPTLTEIPAFVELSSHQIAMQWLLGFPGLIALGVIQLMGFILTMTNSRELSRWSNGDIRRVFWAGLFSLLAFPSVLTWRLGSWGYDILLAFGRSDRSSLYTWIRERFWLGKHPFRKKIKELRRKLRQAARKRTRGEFSDNEVQETLRILRDYEEIYPYATRREERDAKFAAFRDQYLEQLKELDSDRADAVDAARELRLTLEDKFEELEAQQVAHT